MLDLYHRLGISWKRYRVDRITQEAFDVRSLAIRPFIGIELFRQLLLWSIDVHFLVPTSSGHDPSSILSRARHDVNSILQVVAAFIQQSAARVVHHQLSRH